MLNLIEMLPEEHKELLTVYMQHYSEAGKYYCGNDVFLNEWAKNKKGLYQLLGGFTKTIPFKCEKETRIIKSELYTLVSNSAFFTSILYDILGLDMVEEDLDDNIISYGELLSCIEDNTPITKTIKYKAPNAKKMLQISAGCLPMRALGKIVNYLYDNFDKVREYYPDIRELYEDFRQKQSYILNDKELKGNLVLSILPLDFLTMSNNSFGWSSCMEWSNNNANKESGCYHAGTIEMMNSNNVVCCYLDSKIPYEFYKDETTGKSYKWNNKKWRILTIVTPEIICSGKAYPYQHEVLAKTVVSNLRELAKVNKKWTYTYGIEEYKDMNNINSMYGMQKMRYYTREQKDGKKHSIIFDTLGMYNDYLNDCHTKYYCVRNYVKNNIIIKYSGKTICTCCGTSYIDDSYYINNACDFYYDEDEDYDDYNERFEDLPSSDICPECSNTLPRCYCCNKIDNIPNQPHRIYKGKSFCHSCLKDILKICPECNKIYEINDYDIGLNKNSKSAVYIPQQKYSEDEMIFNRNYSAWKVKDFFYKICVCRECTEDIVNNNKMGHTKMLKVNFCGQDKYYALTKAPSYDENWLSKYTIAHSATDEQIMELTTAKDED